ncbi:MAG: hypothetical protein Q9181_006239 [Wetmoreana brouardii]
MLEKEAAITDKSLPPTPRPSHERALEPLSAPELYIHEGLIPKPVSTTLPEVRVTQGLERTFEALEPTPTGYDPPIVLGNEHKMSIRRTRKRYILIILVSIILIVALAAGLGKGLHKGTAGRLDLKAPSSDPPWTPFNVSTPLPKSNVKPTDWRGRSIYQVITDRFGPPGTELPPCDTAKRQYCGGTWQGLIDRLGYIKNMGFTAVWISPVTAQMDTAEGQAYHGYWQQNLYALNPRFGSNGDLQALSSALHARDMYLMLDVVANHYGWAGNSSTVAYKGLVPFNDVKYFHSYCPITRDDYLSNQTAVEQCWLGNSIVSLPDVNTENLFVIETYNNWIKSLVTVFGVDGLRIDTVKHVQKSFWPGFQSAAGVFTLGEVFDGDAAYTCPYQQQLEGLLNYPLYYPMIRAFQGSDGDMSSLSSAISTIQRACRDPTMLGTFSENHDNARFLSHTNDLHLNMNVITFTILSGGIPIIYQGQEQGFSGGNDPANREALWTSSFPTKTALYSLIASVNQIRNHEVFSFPNYLTSPTSVIYTDEHDIALRKGHIVSLFSNIGVNGTAYNVTLTRHGFTANQTVVEILSCKNSTIDRQGDLHVAVKQGLPQVSNFHVPG